jgi:hypothetical protein
VYKCMGNEKVEKIKIMAWYTVYYLVITLFEGWILWNMDWIRDIDMFYQGRPILSDFQGCHALYMIQTGFYIHMIASLVFLEERLNDFHQMLIHHFISLILILGSYRFLWHRMGLVVFFLHDSVDFFLYFAKMFHAKKWMTLANSFFALFCLFFLLFRLVLFPFVVIWPVFNAPEYTTHAVYHYNAHFHTMWNQRGICLNGHCTSPYLIMAYGILSLFGLHLVWFEQVAKSLFNVLSGSSKDSREE